MSTKDELSTTDIKPCEERHFTVLEIAAMWNLSREFVRQLIRGEPGVTEWVRQAPGKRRYRVLRVPASVVDRLYRRAQERADPGGLPSLAGHPQSLRRQRRRRRPRAAGEFSPT
jgi:hypothetical protein